MDSHSRAVVLKIRAEPAPRPEAQELATFVYDLNLLYELRVLEAMDSEAVSPEYATTWILSRTGRPIPPGTRLVVSRLHYGSPIDLILQLRDALPSIDFVVGAGAIWVLTQTLEKIYNLPASHKLIESQRRLADAQATELERVDPRDRESLTTQRVLVTKGHAALSDLGESVDVASDDRGALPTQRPRARVVNPIPAAENRLRRGRIRITEIDLVLPDDL